MLNLLSVPVVDLVDVPKDNFVFSFHVVRDALFLDPLHEALQGRKNVSRLLGSLLGKQVKPCTR